MAQLTWNEHLTQLRSRLAKIQSQIDDVLDTGAKQSSGALSLEFVPLPILLAQEAKLLKRIERIEARLAVKTDDTVVVPPSDDSVADVVIKTAEGL